MKNTAAGSPERRLPAAVFFMGFRLWGKEARDGVGEKEAAPRLQNWEYRKGGAVERLAVMK
ncbi:hypothetical protein LC724_14015 [Blautia sp. RD014234]|nr:hypothetical protein [Blautia parvula]